MESNAHPPSNQIVLNKLEVFRHVWAKYPTETVSNFKCNVEISGNFNKAIQHCHRSTILIRVKRFQALRASFRGKTIMAPNSTTIAGINEVHRQGCPHEIVMLGLQRSWVGRERQNTDLWVQNHFA